MGGVPTQRHTRGKKNARRSHHALGELAFSVCSKCKKAVLPHHICQYCGTYAGREIIDVFGNLDKKEQKRRKKLEALQHASHSQDFSKGEAVPELNPAELSKK